MRSLEAEQRVRALGETPLRGSATLSPRGVRRSGSRVQVGESLDAPWLDRDIDDLADQAEGFRHDVPEEAGIG
jgi:hypothetical protein